MNLTHSEQTVQEVFERLLVLHCSDKDKADFFLIKAWESYWRKKEYIEGLPRIKRG